MSRRVCIVLIAILLLVSIAPFAQVLPARAAIFNGPLKVSTTNGRYFTDNSGKAIYTVGSDDIYLPDTGSSYPPAATDYDTYLNAVQSHGHNRIRLWRWELPGLNGGFVVAPHPWARNGPGTAADGRPRFNLNTFDQSYFDRLRLLCIKARDRGIYVSIMLFEGGVTSSANNDPTHPLFAANNINGISATSSTVHALTNSAIVSIHEAYVRKVVDTVNDLDNIFYEVENESTIDNLDFQEHIMSVVRAYESTKAKQHPIGLSTGRGRPITDTDLFTSTADWIQPVGDSYVTNPSAATGAKVIVTDTDHLNRDTLYGSKDLNGNRPYTPSLQYAYVWKSFTRGIHTHQLGGGGEGLGFPDTEKPYRESAAKALAYATKMDLMGMTPQTASSVCSTTYCLRKSGVEYLVFQPSTSTSNTFTVNLPGGSFTVEWYRPSTNTTLTGGTSGSNASGNRTFTPPFAGQAVLYLKQAPSTTPTPTATPTPGTGSLSGSQTTPASTINLSTEGARDWAHWGTSSASSFDHKSGVTQQISNYTKVGSGTVLRYSDNAIGYTWSGGVPTTSATNSKTGLYTSGLGNGFKITVPADVTSRTVKVYVGVYNAQGRFTATLSDNSAPAYTDSTLTASGDTSSNGVYTITYKAGSSSQNLTLTFIVLQDNGSGNVTLQSVTMP